MKEILQEDRDLVLKRIAEIKQELRELANEFKQTLTESSETWHDNSPWDNAKAKEAVLLSEEERLEYIKKSYQVIESSEESLYGRCHDLEFNGNKAKVYLAGDFSMRTGMKIGEYIVVTKDSPVAQSLLDS